MILRVIAIILFLNAYFISVYTFHPFMLKVLAYLAFVYFFIPCALIALLWIIFARKTGRNHIPAHYLLNGALGGALLVFCAVPINTFLYEREEKIAKEYVLQVKPLLESYRTTHGKYPGSLSELPVGSPNVPRLLKNFPAYFPESDHFIISFSSSTGGIFDTWNYDSKTGVWQRIVD